MRIVNACTGERLDHTLSPPAEPSRTGARGEVWVVLILAGGEECRDTLDDLACPAMLVLQSFDDGLKCSRGDPLLGMGVEASVYQSEPARPFRRGASTKYSRRS